MWKYVVRILRGVLRYERQKLDGAPVIALIAFVALALACGLAIRDYLSELPCQNWNVSEFEELTETRPGPLKFAVLGDSKNDRKQFESLLQSIANDPEISFVLTLGDMVAKGDIQHYTDFIGRVQKYSNVPVLLCPGNHELTAGGDENYPRLAGMMYYSFQIGDAGFLVVDDVSSRHMDERQLNWIQRELNRFKNLRFRIIALHTPPFDPRGESHDHGLDDTEAQRLMDVLKRGMATHIFASHVHGYYGGKWQDIPFWITGGAGARLAGEDPDHAYYHYLKISIARESLDVEVVRPTVDSGIGAHRLAYEIDRFVWSWIRFRQAHMALIIAFVAMAAAHLRSCFVRQPAKSPADISILQEIVEQ